MSSSVMTAAQHRSANPSPRSQGWDTHGPHPSLEGWALEEVTKLFLEEVTVELSLKG